MKNNSRTGDVPTNCRIMRYRGLWDERTRSRIRTALAAVGAVFLMLTGCTTGQEAAKDDVEARIAEIAPMDLPASIVRYGIGLTLPADARVFEPFNGLPESTTVPRGIVLHFESVAGAVAGTVQIVPIPENMHTAGETYLPTYFSTFDVLKGPPVYVSLPGSKLPEAAWGVPVNRPAEKAAVGSTASDNAASDHELLVVFAPFDRQISQTHGVLLEIEFPRERIDLAVSIASGLQLPRQMDELMHSQRIRVVHDVNTDSVGDELAFHDDTGTWSWVADTHHGFVIRRRRNGHDLYVALDRWDDVTAAAPESSNGPGSSASANQGSAEQAPSKIHVDISYGSWRWEVPLITSFTGDRRRWIGRIPSPDTGRDLRIDVIEPSRAWRDGRPETISIEAELQALFDWAVTIGQ